MKTEDIFGVIVIHLGDIIVTVENAGTDCDYSGNIYDAEGCGDSTEELEAFMDRVDDFEVEPLDGGEFEGSEDEAIENFTDRQEIDRLRMQYLNKERV